jgi:haloacetate dehalogenase
MNRRTFSLMGLGTAVADLVSSSSAQTGRVPSFSNLEQALPSSLPGPAPCAKLPQVPLPPSDVVSQELFSGFRSQFLKTSSATIRVLTKGDGPPLLLLHDPDPNGNQTPKAERCQSAYPDALGVAWPDGHRVAF